MKKIAVAVSLIFILNLFTFMPALAEEEIIAQPSVAAGNSHVLGLNQYGRVFSAGDNTYGQCDTFYWKDITQVCAGKYFSAGLKSDGTIVVAGTQTDGTEIDVSELTNIVQISAGDNFLAALDMDGGVHTVGNIGNIDTGSWDNVVQIACGNQHIVALLNDNKTVLGCEYDDGKMDIDFDNIFIEEIYAGEKLTVVKDEYGRLHHHGEGTYFVGETSEEESRWLCSEWENVNSLIIEKGVGINGIVIAIKDGSILTDGTNKNYSGWSTDFISKLQNLSNVKNIAILNHEFKYYAIVIDENETIQYISDNNISNSLTAEIEQFDLTIKPIKLKSDKIQVVPSYRTVGIIMPNGEICTIGPTVLADFKDIKSLDATVSSYDYFIGVNDKNTIISNLPAEDASLMNGWKGIEKVATAVWNGEDKLIAALRWDGHVYSTYENGLVKSLNNVVDIAGGNYYTVALTNKNVVLLENNNTTLKNFDVSSWKNIESVFSGYTHIIGINQFGGCVATGKNSNGECNVETWANIVDVACGNLFTVGVDNEGNCYYTGKTGSSTSLYTKMKSEIETWKNVESVFAANNYVIAHKKDGMFEFTTALSTLTIEEQIENTYYKDNVFYTYKIDGNTATIEYYSDEELEAYLTYFDASGNPVDFEKVTLEPNDTLTKVVCTSEKAAESCTMSIGEPTSKKMKFYIEEETESDGIALRYCADEGRRVTVTFYDEKNNMMDVKVKTLPASDAMTTINYSCIDAAKYKLFIWDGVTPLYKSEGFLN